MNKYKIYPKCPKCEFKGPLASKGIRQCLHDGCSVRLYWHGGIDCGSSYSDPIIEEKEFHFNKENIMIRAFKKYFEKIGYA